jgi:hypothetical protein
LAVVGVTVAGLAVVGVTAAALAAVVVVVLAAAGAAVVEVVLVDFFSVVVVLEACFVGLLDPHAAAMRPPATTKVTTTHRVFPVRPGAASATSGVTFLNTAAPLVGAIPDYRRAQGRGLLRRHIPNWAT